MSEGAPICVAGRAFASDGELIGDTVLLLRKVREGFVMDALRCPGEVKVYYPIRRVDGVIRVIMPGGHIELESSEKAESLL